MPAKDFEVLSSHLLGFGSVAAPQSSLLDGAFWNTLRRDAYVWARV